MIFTICSVKDRAADVFGVPAFVPNKGAYIRSFSDEVNREAADNNLFKHPGDFDLYELGTYDDNEAKFEVHTPKLLVRGEDVKRAK